MPIHHLHEPVDVFSEWLDECEAAQNPRDEGETHHQQYAEDDDDDDDIPESSGLATKGSKKPVASSNYAEDIVDVGDSEDDEDE